MNSSSSSYSSSLLDQQNFSAPYGTTTTIREFLNQIDRILSSDVRQLHTLKPSIDQLIVIARRYVQSAQYSKSAFFIRLLSGLLDKCQEVPPDKKPALLRVWIEIQTDPELLQISPIDKYNISVQVNAFKMVYIDTLTKLRSETDNVQFYDMLQIRNDLRKVLPDADFSDVDREIYRIHFMGQIIKANPQLKPDYGRLKGRNCHLSKTYETFQRQPTISTVGLSTTGMDQQTEVKLPTCSMRATAQKMPTPNPKLTITPEAALESITSLKRKLLETNPTKRYKSLQEAIMELKEETIALLNTQEMNIISQKQCFKNIVSIVRSYSTTRFCRFIFINYLVDTFVKDSKIVTLFHHQNTKYAGRLWLWAICEILNDNYLPYPTTSNNSKADSTHLYEPLKIDLLQKAFIRIHSQAKMSTFDEFVAIRQLLGRGIHSRLDLIDNHALKIRPNLNWEQSITNYPAKSREHFISPEAFNIFRSSDKDLRTFKLPTYNIKHSQVVNSVTISNSLNSYENHPVTFSTAPCPVTTWKPQFSPELECEEETSDNDVVLLEEFHKDNHSYLQDFVMHKEGYSPRDQTSVSRCSTILIESQKVTKTKKKKKKKTHAIVSNLDGSDLRNFLETCREESARIKADLIHKEQMKAAENEARFTKQVDVYNHNVGRKENDNDEEDPTFIRPVNNLTNGIPCKVRIAPKVAIFNSTSSQPISQPSHSSHTNTSSTVTSTSSKATSNCQSTGNKGGSWTASILPTNHKGQSALKNQESFKNNDVSSTCSSKKPELSKLEELRLKLSKDEAITTLPSIASIRKKECTIILLKDDFTAEEYINYFCSPLLKSYCFIKVFGKYRIRIVHHPAVNPSDSS